MIRPDLDWGEYREAAGRPLSVDGIPTRRYNAHNQQTVVFQPLVMLKSDSGEEWSCPARWPIPRGTADLDARPYWASRLT